MIATQLVFNRRFRRKHNITYSVLWSVLARFKKFREEWNEHVCVCLRRDGFALTICVGHVIQRIFDTCYYHKCAKPQVQVLLVQNYYEGANSA